VSHAAMRGRREGDMESVVLEIIVERVTNTSMGTELDKVMGFEELVLKPEDAPSTVKLLD